MKNNMKVLRSDGINEGEHEGAYDGINEREGDHKGIEVSMQVKLIMLKKWSIMKVMI